MQTVGVKRYVIAYDIADDRRRAAVVKELKGVGYRVQFSLFEVEMTEQTLMELRIRISSCIKNAEDSVVYYGRCKRCQQDVIRDGIVCNHLDDEDLYIV